MTETNESRKLLAKLAVAEGMITPQVAQRVLELLDQQEEDLGELLVRLGHITPPQREKLAVLVQSARGPSPTGEEARLFGETVIRRGLATREQVAACLKKQAELQSGGRFKNLGEIMVEAGILAREQVMEMIRAQDQSILVCPACSEQYNVLRSWEGTAKCPADGTLLESVAGETAVGVAATLADVPSSPVGMECGGCRIVELIARGTMGAVYKAKHVGLNRYVAVKMLPKMSDDPDLVKRLLFEARAIAKLEHPNIVQVYDVGFHRGYFFIVMQLLKGQTLEERLQEMGMLPQDTALDIVRDVAQGLEAAHRRGIIHRDLKPANVMITEEGLSRLTDFGLAQDVENPEEQTGVIVGTPYYMAPEQWLGHKADERSDLYALGIILFQILCGRKPFEGTAIHELMNCHLKVAPPSPRTFNPELSEGLTAVIRKLIAKAPKRRYPNATEFLADLRRVRSGQDPDALAQFSTQVKCGFCESLNPTGERKCKVCGESLGGFDGPLEIAARPDEFKCPGCGGLNRKGTRTCTDCRRPFCARCRQRLAVLKGHCEHCMTQIRRR